MWKASLPGGGGPGPSLVLLLLCSLVLSGALAYQAQDAARSHRAASESALRDYAALAGEELARQLGGEAEDLANEVLYARGDAERRRTPAARLAEFEDEMREQIGPCDCPQHLHDYFSLEFDDGSVEFREKSLPGHLRAWIADTVRLDAEAEEVRRRQEVEPVPERGHRRGRREFPDGLARVEIPGRPGSALFYSVVLDDDGDLERAYGLVIDGTAFAAASTKAIVSEMALLPPSLTRGAPADGMLSVAVSSDGESLFSSGGGVEEFATEAVDTLNTPLGSYLLRVAVRPEMAGRLVIGGLPRSRLPLLVGIFLLTLGLSAVAIVQLRRQQALVRLRSGFVASVSHELRTPLAQIRLFSDLLGSGRLGEEQRARSVRIIGEEAQRLAYLVENVLRFSRSDHRSDRLSRESIDLASLTREVVEGFVPLAAARDARIEVSLEPGAVASLDQDAIRQVLLNLLDNAVKYGPPGQTVRVGVSREGAMVRLQVDDEGPGVPAADRVAVWEPYHRLQRDVDAATGGSGIGLAVVRDLVTMHGGTVAVDAVPGGGARFLAWFPAEPRRAARRTARRVGSSEVPA
jgi:signal transduction histidine kinase